MAQPRKIVRIPLQTDGVDVDVSDYIELIDTMLFAWLLSLLTEKEPCAIYQTELPECYEHGYFAYHPDL